MAEYHVGCGFAEIYAGTLNKKGDMWVNKTVVTDEAISAVAQYLLEHEEKLRFEYNGHKFVLAISQTESEDKE